MQSPGGCLLVARTACNRHRSRPSWPSPRSPRFEAEYQDSESEAVSEQIGGHVVSGYDFNFFYLDFTSTALIRGFRTPTASCLVLCQAEDRELAELAPVFRAITTSLLAS